MQAPGGNLVAHRMQQGYVHPRRALLHLNGHRESYGASQVVAGQEAPAGDGSSFDANVVMILAVLLCALICALGLNSIVRCALRCSSSRMFPEAGNRELASVARLEQARVRRKALRAMPTLVYSAEQASACAICLADLEPGERVRVLPKCNHGFHVRCVDRWLMARSTCPTCRQPLFGEARKAYRCAEDDAAPAPVRSFFVPLPPEGFVTPYDF
ncbi:unnamed protein product [Alopecurus aequalis]